MDPKRYKDLKVWKEAQQLTLEVYRLVKSLALDNERIGEDLRKLAQSIPDNIAQGSKYKKHWEYVQQLNLARRSIEGIRTILFDMRDGDVLSKDVFDPINTKCKVIDSLIKEFISQIKIEH